MPISTKKRSPSTGKHHRIEVPTGRVRKIITTGSLGLPLDYEDPPVPGTEGRDLDAPEKERLEYEHSKTLAPGETWLTLPWCERVDQPPSKPKSVAQHAWDARRIGRADRFSRVSLYQPEDWPPPPAVADANNKILVDFLKMSLDWEGYQKSLPPEQCADNHPDYDGPYRSSTWTELATEMEWGGEFLAGAYRLASQMGLLREKAMNEDGNKGIKKKSDKKINRDDPLHIKIALGYIIMMEIDSRLRRFNDVEGRSLQMWKYENGLWSWLPDRTVTKWLMPQLQQILNYVSREKNSTVLVLNEAAQHVIRHEKICIDSEAVFDQHGKVPTRDGLIDPITREIESLKPEHFATWVLPKVKYDPAAQCPYWIQMLNDALSDKSEEERELDIRLIQDWMGMSLLNAKQKDLQRGLILLGPGDTGKSSLQQVMAGMLADKWITTPLSALSGPHGTQAFIKRAPWVLGEAFTTSVWHLADTVKMILGGDSIEINPKNKDAICVKPNAPAIWATNYEPKFKEPTRAIVERIVVMKLTKVFDKSKPVGVAAAAKKINPSWWPHDLVLNTERAGVLNWMLDGAKRALQEGCYINTKAGKDLLESILDDSNVARAFIKDCSDPDPNAMISTPDFMQALVQWWHEHHGDEAKPPSATMVGLHLKAMSDPRYLQDKNIFKDENGLRFYLGIRLNKSGLDYWTTANMEDNQSGRSSRSAARTSSSEAAVTRAIKNDWLKLPEVVTMQKAHGKNS